MDRRGWLQPAIDAFMLEGDFPGTIASGAVYDAEVPAINGVLHRAVARAACTRRSRSAAPSTA